MAATASPSASDPTGSTTPSLPRRPEHGRVPPWLHGVLAATFLYLFLCAINVMGSGLKALGGSGDLLPRLLALGDNPVVALTAGVLITATVQSSSFTTSLIITLAAAGQMNLETAVFAVMGANIGTSVTNTIVSLGNVRIRRQFRRAFTAAIIHDMFNLLTVALLFPIEWITAALSRDGLGILARISHWMADLLGLGAIEKPHSPIKVITKPVVGAVEWVAERIVGADRPGTLGAIVAILGLALLFVSLMMMVRSLRGALLRRLEGLFRRVFFRNDATAYGIGAITTILVQSSSVTTSLVVPLAGAGAVKLKRVFPFTLGANLGTTVTGVIAATANPATAAVVVAISHVSFNLIGTIVWYTFRRVPIRMARSYGRLAAKSKRYALYFLLGVFLIAPAIALTVTEVLMYLFGH
jgi:sodium-dependent phosphate cotransporter